MGIHSEAILNRKFMEMIKLLNIYLNHFPRHEKFALSNNIRNTAYGIYDLITECQKSYKKAIKKLKVESIISLIGHAKGTGTIPFYKRLLIEFKIFNLLPQRSQACLNI